jgi:hypothetical protein
LTFELFSVGLGSQALTANDSSNPTKIFLVMIYSPIQVNFGLAFSLPARAD